jgi:hypothetical protein
MVSANVETNKLFAEQTTKAVQTKKDPFAILTEQVLQKM